MRRDPIFAFTDPAQLASGLMPDKHLLQAPLWAIASGVRFYGGKIKKLGQPSLATTGSAHPVRGVGQQQTSDGVRWLWFATGPNVYRWYGPAAGLVQAASPWVENEGTSPATFYDFTPWGDWMVINSPELTRPILYKPAGTNDFIAAAPTNVLQMMKMNNFLMAIGWDANFHRFSWSDADDIETWAGGTGHEAGDLPIEDFDTPMRAVCRLGSMIACFAEDQMALIQYIGAPFYFGRRVALDGIGCVGKAAVASDGRMAYGFGVNGAWRTDGSSFEYIDTSVLRDYFQEQVNWSQISKTVVSRNDKTGCFEYHFPLGASSVINKAWSFDPKTGAWAPCLSWAYTTERKVFRNTLAGNAVGEVYFQDYQNTGSLALALRTKPLAVSSPHSGAMIDQVDVFLKDVSACQMRVGGAEVVDGAITWTGWIDLSGQSTTYTFKPLPSSVWHWVEFQSTADTWRFDLQGFALYGVAEGAKRSLL